MSEIPQRLKDPRLHFVLVKKRDKAPIEPGWQKTANYAHDDPKLLQHLARGGNYGVLCGVGGLAVIDADSDEVRQAVNASLPPTLTIKTGRDGRHYYYYCPDLDGPIRLSQEGKPDGNIGDVQYTGKQVIGPGSIHQNGNAYVVLDDRPIAEVKAEDILFALRDFIKVDAPDPEETKLPDGKNANDELRIENVVPLGGLKRRGDKYQGPHPKHGSDTGQNFSLDIPKNVWHCHRHGTGGGPFQWIAVEEGIIDCSECRKGALRGERFKQVRKVAEEKYGLPPQEKRGVRHNLEIAGNSKGPKSLSGVARENIRAVRCIEPYRDEEGKLGFAVIDSSGRIIIKTYDEWLKDATSEEEKHLVKYELGEYVNPFWETPKNPLPGEPNPNYEFDLRLNQSIQRNCARTVYHIDNRYYQLQASYEMCTYLKELLNFAPRLTFHGPTGSGKSHALDHCIRMSHRGYDYTDPSVAALTREIGTHGITACIDSWHKIKDERKHELLQIYEKGFEQGGTVARVGQDDRVHRYPIYGWMAFATIYQPKVEEIANRGIPIPMAQKPPDHKLERRIDMDGTRQLKTELTSLRLAAMSGKIDVRKILDSASLKAENYTPPLEPRAIDIAESLLVPDVLYQLHDPDGREDDPDAILGVIADSQEVARRFLQDSLLADVYYAIQGVVMNNTTTSIEDGGNIVNFSRITTKAVNEQLISDLALKNELTKDDNKKPKTRGTTGLIIDLGYRLAPQAGAQRATLFDEKAFWPTHNRLLAKFGHRGKAEDSEEGKP